MDFKDPAIDVAGLARSFGVEAHRIEDAAGFDAALEAALAAEGPVVLEVMVDGTV
jgi:benzoylformate decarboxylase